MLGTAKARPCKTNQRENGMDREPNSVEEEAAFDKQKRVRRRGE